MLLYHGSDHIIEKPEFGAGKKHNDYGRGFYCTQNIELAKEWAVSEDADGYVNKYSIYTPEMVTFSGWLSRIVTVTSITPSRPNARP